MAPQRRKRQPKTATTIDNDFIGTGKDQPGFIMEKVDEEIGKVYK